MAAPSGLSSNPFEVLGLDRSASFEEVKLAYRRLAREYHPDANPNDPMALERFTALRRAYERLKIFYQTLEDVEGAPDGPAAAQAAATAGHSDRQAAVPPQREPMPEPPLSTNGARHEAAGEMPVTPPGARRAFRRTGPIRHPGEGDGHLAPAGRVAEVKLPEPLRIGGGHLALRAEVLYSYQIVAPSPQPQMLYALISLRTSETVSFPRVPLNLCLVLDHSSSMLRGGKVERLKDMVGELVKQLDQDDYLSIVSFGDRAEVLLPAQPLSDPSLVRTAIDSMRCRGGTEISRGLASGLSELSLNASRAVSHLILLTDGQTDGDEMACLERAEEAAALNVGITAFGLGADWNSTLLDGIARPTGGHSDYIESPEAMVQAFIARVSALQSTNLRRTVLGVNVVASQLQRATLVSPMMQPLEFSAERGTPMAIIGEISSATEYQLLAEFQLMPCQPGAVRVADLTVTYDVPGLQREREALIIPISTTAATDPDVPLQADPRVTDMLRKVTANRLQERAWHEIETGNAAKGTGLLKRAAEHLEVAGHADLAQVAIAEAERVERGNDANDENVKRIIYGTRRLAQTAHQG